LRRDYYNQWIKEGKHGTMAWMENNNERRLNPGFLMGLFSGVAEFPVAILISVAAAAPIGLSVGLIAAPLVFALHKFGYCRLLTMSIAGAICGVLLAHITDVSWYLFVVAVFSGAFGGFAAWIGGQGPIRNDSHLDMALNQ
ncbi:MAG: hypothetical protein AAF493_03780, partial [Pseudomonadota bacterium]